jgi:hypothetical protein
MVLKMTETIGNLETGQKTSTLTLGKVPKQARSINMPTVTGTAMEKNEAANPLGTRFTIFALTFNAIGLATVTFSGTPIAGNMIAGEIVLGSSMVCLSAYLARSISANKKKTRLTGLFSKHPTD